MTFRKRYPRTFRAAAVVMLLALTLAVSIPVLASVTLTAFEAVAQDNSTIRVTWAAATELDTASYQLYRSESASPTDWGNPIYAVAAGGSVSPANYEYIDSAVTAGVTYYYRLNDISTQGTPTSHGPKPARIMLPGEVATSTPTSTATWTMPPTATTGFVGASGGTPTPTLPPPTATRRYTNTPAISPLATPFPGAPTSVAVSGRVQPTPLPGARVATPTGSPVVMPTAPLASEPTAAVLAAQPTLMPTVALLAQAPGAGQETATPVPSREVTPIIFSASETKEAGAMAGSSEAVASQGGRSTTLALTVGGAALGLAGLLAALLLFLRSRKG